MRRKTMPVRRAEKVVDLDAARKIRAALPANGFERMIAKARARSMAQSKVHWARVAAFFAIAVVVFTAGFLTGRF
jgi:hypothetical protein